MSYVPRKWLLLSAVIATAFSATWFYSDPDFEPGLAVLTSLGFLAQQLFFPALPERTTAGFRAGDRAKWCRIQLGWTVSQATEQLDIESETLFQQMESGVHDIPSQTLQRLSEITGVSLEWLKHGDARNYRFHELRNFVPHSFQRKLPKSQWVPFPPRDLRLYDEDDVTESVSAILKDSPQSLYFALDPESCSAAFVIAKRDNHYTVWDLHALDFWEEYVWASDLNYIPFIYSFLKALIESDRVNCEGLYLNESEIRCLALGHTYPETIIRDAQFRAYKAKRYSNIRHWPEDLLDFKHSNSPAETYAAWYGEWIVKAQHYFADRVEQN